MNTWVTSLIVAAAMLLALAIAWKLKDREL
jgi:hypothetical protein